MQIWGEYMFPLSLFCPPHSPRLFHLTDLLIFFYPWPFLFLLKILCPNCLDCCPLPPRQKFASFNTVQVSIAVQDPTISHKNSCPGCKQRKSWQSLPMDPPVLSSHMELLLSLGERRSNQQLLAELLLFLSPGNQRNPCVLLPLWLTDLALLPVNCKIGFRWFYVAE